MCMDTPIAIRIKKTLIRKTSTANMAEHPIVIHSRARVRTFTFNGTAFLCW